jgi:ferredoxin-NADP reductase/DMSO/TMAO reductase YedYZ heme-binding membrane subunit
VNFAIRTTGMLTLVFLFLTLLVTPIRKITGWNWLIFSRRTLGLYAFFYGCAHFLLFYGLDRSFSVASTFSEMLKRKYLFVGISGLLLMAPLAATSTNAMIKRLGGPRWRALHRLVYLAAIAGVLHYYMLVKADVRQPLAFAAALGLLFGFRLVAYGRRPMAPQFAGVAKPKMWSGSLRVERIVQETPEVRTFRLVSPDGGRLSFDYRAGQYLILSLLIGGKKVTRTYTIASSPTRPAYCELTIKREEKGLASRHLHDTVREGDLLNVSAPAGRFTFDEDRAKSVVLIAGGVGITPLMSILRFLTDRNWKGDIHFLYCAKTPRDIIFHQELEDLRRRFSNLHLVVTLTRAEAMDWAGRKGRIGGDLLRQKQPPFCGLQRFSRVAVIPGFSARGAWRGISVERIGRAIAGSIPHPSAINAFRTGAARWTGVVCGGTAGCTRFVVLDGNVLRGDDHQADRLPVLPIEASELSFRQHDATWETNLQRFQSGDALPDPGDLELPDHAFGNQHEGVGIADAAKVNRIVGLVVHADPAGRSPPAERDEHHCRQTQAHCSHASILGSPAPPATAAAMFIGGKTLLN